MRHAFILLLLILLPGASGLTYHMPVIVTSTTSPQVLMPGDSAVLTIEMQNGAAIYGAGGETRGATISTPVEVVKLLGDREIRVVSGDYRDIGLIGPSDRVLIYYKIEADEGISDGTYFLDLLVTAGYDGLSIVRKIPVKVDSSGVSLSLADSSGKSTVSLNVANPRSNTLNAVSILPFAGGIRFSPEEYYIGTMDPDEVFTISFRIEPSILGNDLRGSQNLSFQSHFKNGDTWHTSSIYNTSFTPMLDGTRQNSMVPAFGFVLMLIVFAMYLRWLTKHPESRLWGSMK